MVVEIEIFVSQGCELCRLAREVVKKVTEKYPGDVHVSEVDMLKEKELSEELGISSAPVVLVDRDTRFVGVPREEYLLDAVQKKIKEERK